MSDKKDSNQPCTRTQAIEDGALVDRTYYTKVNERCRGGRSRLFRHRGMSNMTQTNLYRYERSKDGCDETFDIYGPGDEKPMISLGFWDAEAKTEVTARRIVDALNAWATPESHALESKRSSTDSRFKRPSRIGQSLRWRRRT